MEEGDSATLVETMTNDKFLPIPVLTLSFKVDRSIEIDEDRNATVSDKTNVVEYFGLGAHEVITRRQPVKAAKRGYYLIDEAGITLPDFFSESVRYMNTEQAASLLVCPRMLDGNEIIDISRQIIGDVIARSRLYQDVFSFRGIREYTPADPLNAVNWKASARTGDYMVGTTRADSTCGSFWTWNLRPSAIGKNFLNRRSGLPIRLPADASGRISRSALPPTGET